MTIKPVQVYPESVTFEGSEVEVLWRALSLAVKEMSSLSPDRQWVAATYKALSYALHREPQYK